MAELIYTLCALTSATCAWLLLRGYAQNRYRLLFWSGLCFAGLTVNNLLLILDKVVFPTAIDLSTWRLVAALLAPMLLLYGLISEDE
jgi:hypothetical protein